MPLLPRLSARLRYLATVTAGLALAILGPSAATMAQTTAPATSTILAFSASETTAPVVLGPDGGLYGTARTTVFGTTGLIYRAAQDGSRISTIYQLGTNDGVSPTAGLLLGSDGRLYGTTTFGVAAQSGSFGTIFSLRPDGSDFRTLHEFSVVTGTSSVGFLVNPDGVYPDSSLLEGNDGYLYGMTRQGGSNATGVVFRLTKDGSVFEVLHEFGPLTSADDALFLTNADGFNGAATLLEYSDGYLYGTSTNGGENGRGTMFRLRPDGTGFEVLHAFSATVASEDGLPTNDEGAAPIGGVVDGQDGLLYGTASQGGAGGYGTVYSFAVGAGVTAVHDFDSSNGAAPSAALILGRDGRLYGTTIAGGANAAGSLLNLGTAFSMARDGSDLQVLHVFDGANGVNPSSSLLQLSDSVFVGTTKTGGTCAQGTLYRVSLAGDTVDGSTKCGRKKNNNSGGGSGGAAVLLLLGVLGLARRLR
jgi:uncharacterized repeat protein (TIGR03803 family)